MPDGMTWMAVLAGLALGWFLRARLARSRVDTRPAAASDAAAASTGQLAEALVDRAGQAMVVVDGRDRLVLANAQAREWLRLGSAAAGDAFVPLARSADLVDCLRQARAGEGVVRDIELNRAPSPNVSIRVSAMPLPERAGEVALLIDDITRLRRLESVERELVANVSHDLRTPVTILRGYAETLAQDHATLPAEERARFIGKIVSATGRLAGMLEGMLALASLESGASIRREPGGLASAAAEVVEALRDRAAASGVRLHLEVGPAAGAADPELARRLVQNLVENALNHARGATEVRVRVAGDTLEVADDGPGVSTADLGRLFDRFYRADRSRRQGGSGIGLSLVRQIAELHGGSVSAEAVRPHGLRIKVSLAGRA